MRTRLTFDLPEHFSKTLFLHWLASHDIACVFESNSRNQTFTDHYHRFEFMAAAGNAADKLPVATTFAELEKLLEDKNENVREPMVGFFTYDLKNEIENLSSANADAIDFPLLRFFCPRWLFTVEENKMHIDFLSELDSKEQIIDLFRQIISFVPIAVSEWQINGVRQRVSRDDYVRNVAEIQKHIQRGDVYELNYCVEFFSENCSIDMVEAWMEMNEFSPMPFSCFVKWKDKFLACASPERFLAKRNQKIISQPIKGTARRGNNADEDKIIVDRLRHDPKERAENVMIVDLVRNDLGRTAMRNSVVVEDLFGVYTFRNLHQMISTVVSEVAPSISAVDIIKGAFPMGSMTGAPKIRAMELIEKFENTKRGLYSGAVGYFSPTGDFDFNVVIRSLQYNASSKYLSFMVGSAITAKSDPEKEYDECLLKAEAMLRVLAHPL